MSKLFPAPVGGTGYWSISPSRTNEIEPADDVRAYRQVVDRHGVDEQVIDLVFRVPMFRTLRTYSLNIEAAKQLHARLGAELKRCGFLADQLERIP